MVSPSASGFLPGLQGLHAAVVRKLDGDPLKEYRIQIELPWMDGKNKLLWARLSTMYATNASGNFFLPEPDDEVVVGFMNEDPGHPIILGGVYGEKHKPPYEYEAKNNTKAIVTREKMRIEFNEEKKVITISTPGKNSILVISYIGYSTEEVKINDRRNINIRLREDTKALDEVVVVGYGQQKKESVVVSMSSVKVSDITAPTRNLTNNLA